VKAIDLPGAGEDTTPVAEVTLDRYAERVCEALSGGPPAVLVGHSMGGMVITQAAARCPERIARLIYVAAFLPQDGQSLIDLTHLPEAAGDQVQANLVVEGDPPVATMREEAVRNALFHCCDEEAVAWALPLRGPQAVAPFAAPAQLNGPARDAFAALPRAYVMCLQDRAIKPALQRRMLEAAGCDPVIEIDTDHCVWASRPDELAAALDRLAA
jgi:pimeloyl-ACP methyl ester carboxylesterase